MRERSIRSKHISRPSMDIYTHEQLVCKLDSQYLDQYLAFTYTGLRTHINIWDLPTLV